MALNSPTAISAVTPLLPINGPGKNFASPLPASARQQPASDAEKAARQFEALFVKQLLSEVKISSGFGGESDARSDFVDSMWRDRISNQMVSQGDGLGLAKMLTRQLQGQPAQASGAIPFPAGAESNWTAMPLSGMPAVETPNAKLGATVNKADGGHGLRMYSQYLPESPRFSDAEDFVRTLKPHIEKAAQALGVSPQILMAQAALETGWGAHMPGAGDSKAGPSYNLFGIKADRSWQGDSAQAQTMEYDGNSMVETRAGFRRYDSYADSVDDYVQFIRDNPRYQNALQHGGSDKNFVLGLKLGGYATDPDYVEKVFEVAQGSTLARHWNAL